MLTSTRGITESRSGSFHWIYLTAQSLNVRPYFSDYLKRRSRPETSWLWQATTAMNIAIRIIKIVVFFFAYHLLATFGVTRTSVHPWLMVASVPQTTPSKNRWKCHHDDVLTQLADPYELNSWPITRRRSVIQDLRVGAGDFIPRIFDYFAISWGHLSPVRVPIVSGLTSAKGFSLRRKCRYFEQVTRYPERAVSKLVCK